MSQINVNTPPPVEPASGDRTAAAGINMLTVLIVLGVLVVVAWYLFTGPLHSMLSGPTTVNVNPAPATVNVNPPSAPAPANNAPANNAPAPANNAPAPAKP